ncbi:MAG TPA: serine/threonine-protein kinase, partial [Thermoanaerobaculia bacterium]
MEPAGRSIGPYRVIRTLGRGGMGEVFLAYDPRLDRQVAIKSIRADSDDPEHRARFLREARVTAALSHPSIVQVFDLPSEEGSDYIVMEYLAGTSLHELLRQGPLPLHDRLRIATAVAEGLAYAHGRGVVHRDLKTENVLVTPGGEVKIADFGIARRRSSAVAGSVDESLTREGMVVGTWRVMAPEQACGEPPDRRSDLFSFGVLLYELFTGQSPFLADTPSRTAHRILSHTPAPLREVDPALPPELSEIVEHLLEKDPELRPWSTGEVTDRLRSLAGLPGSGSHGEATARPSAAVS